MNKNSFPIAAVVPALFDSETSNKLGKGLNPLSWELLPTEAVSFTSEPAEQRRDTSGYTKAIESKKQLRTVITQSLGGGYNWGTGNASGGIDILNESSVCEQTIGVAAVLRVLTREVSLKEPVLKPEAIKLFQKNPKLFFTQHGDRFCSKVIKGGALIVTAEFYCRSVSEKEVVKTHIEAKGTFSGGVGDAHADYSKTIVRLDDFSHSEVRLWRTGATKSFPSFTQVADHIAEFPTDIEKSGGDAMLYVFSNYSVAKGFDPQEMALPDLHAVLQRLEELEELRSHMQEVQAWAQNAQRYTKQYHKPIVNLDTIVRSAASYEKEIVQVTLQLAQNPFPKTPPAIPSIDETRVGPLPALRPNWEPAIQVIWSDTSGATPDNGVGPGEWTSRTYNHDYNFLQITILDINKKELRVEYRVGHLAMTGDGRRFRESDWVQDYKKNEEAAPPRNIFDWPTSLSMRLEGSLKEAYDIEYEVLMNKAGSKPSNGANGSWAGMHGPAENKYSWSQIRVTVRAKK